MSVHILCGAHKTPYKIPQKTGTEHSFLLPRVYGMSGQIVDQRCSVLFLPFFLAMVSASECRRLGVFVFVLRLRSASPLRPSALECHACDVLMSSPSGRVVAIARYREVVRCSRRSLHHSDSAEPSRAEPSRAPSRAGRL